MCFSKVLLSAYSEVDCTEDNELRRAIYRDASKTRMSAINKALELRKSRLKHQVEKLTAEAREISLAAKALLDVNTIVSSVHESPYERLRTSHEYEAVKSGMTLINDVEAVGFACLSNESDVLIGEPYEYFDDIYYRAKEDLFIKRLHDFMQLELRDDNELLSEWEVYHDELMEIVL